MENSFNTLRHSILCLELNDLYRKKNADYGDSFHISFIEEGMAMPRIRLTDKLMRFKQLTTSGTRKVTDESIRDTLIDLANYAIMTIMEIDALNADDVDEEEEELKNIDGFMYFQ